MAHPWTRARHGPGHAPAPAPPRPRGRMTRQGETHHRITARGVGLKCAALTHRRCRMIPYRKRRCRAFLATCVMCAHSQCQEIDAELRARVRSRTIADAYGVPLRGLAQAAGAVAVSLRPGAGGGAPGFMAAQRGPDSPSSRNPSWQESCSGPIGSPEEMKEVVITTGQGLRKSLAGESCP